MNKTLKIYIGLLALLFVGFVIIEFSSTPPVNWSKTYNENHKIPYGTFILRTELQSLFPNSEINDIKTTPYEYFDSFYSWDDSLYSTHGNFIHIRDRTEIDEVSAQELLDFTNHGNTVFFSSNYLPERFLDSLYLDTTNDYNFKGKAELSLANPIFEKDSITILRGLNNIYFSSVDTLNTTVLGYQNFDSIPRVNFIKVAYGSGNILLHLQPVAFTNYSLLKNENKKYAAAALSYLPEDDLFYDSKIKKGQELGGSPLRFILSQPALKWSLYLALASLILFMIFNAKRRQRIVKVINPLENSTVEFTKTIGNLYYETKDHNNIINKKSTYFLENIRRVYMLDTQILDDKFVKNLAKKSGKKIDKTKRVINLIVYLRAKQECTEENLLSLNNAIEEFYA
ncbi:DUF4350 domain-containing protein [Urechidicola croceus]|uniref:DUF4350 domain-containing protein n=1 Tax=Urechidicola croceus TaxID=1850246 RepID=A0A1D8P4F2_9FLAO|nr:DUF4350 domain-containing protein [Urechidicola croceus]AOW19438.1 hypothetical protein LPB138_01490 [Urechidicola croceus]